MKVDEALRGWVAAVEAALRAAEAAAFRRVAEQLGESWELHERHRLRLEVAGRLVFMRRTQGIPRRFLYAKVDRRGRVLDPSGRRAGHVLDREHLDPFCLWGIEPAWAGGAR